MKRFEVHPNIAKAKTIHTDFYNKTEVFEASKEQIFAQCMHYVGDISLLPDENDAHPLTLLEGLLDEPLLLLRNQQNEVICLSNVCTHRGNLLIDAPCKARKITCKYHGRSFDQCGRMISMPEFKEVEDFPNAQDHLVQLPIFKWGNLLFTSLNPKVNPNDYFKDMMLRMTFFPMDQLVRRDDLSKDYFINANWALYCENYLEGFHIPFVHEGLNHELDFANYQTELYFPYSSLQLGVAKKGEHTFELPASSPDYGQDIAAYYFWIFPNMMFNFYPWGLSLNIVQPVAHNKTKVSFITYMLDETKYNLGAGGNLHKVEMEDEAIVQNVQKGIQSRFYSQGRYSVNKEKGTHHFHRLLAHFIQNY